jgi:hypothetical protein
MNMEYNIEYLPEIGVTRCMRCGKHGVRLADNLKSLIQSMTTGDVPEKEVVNADGTKHICDILDIKNTVNFELV